MSHSAASDGGAHADVTGWMRADWERRARTDPLRSINDREPEGFAFALSGCISAVYLLQPLAHRLRQDMRVLEIGCGVGRMLAVLAGLFDEVHGIDIAPSMIEQARLRLARLPNVRLHLGDGRTLAGLADASFDLAVSFEVFQHVPDKAVIADYVHDAFRVLRRGGIFKFLVKTKPWDGQGERHDTWCGVELGRADLDEWTRRDPWRVDAAYDSEDPTKAFVVLTKP